jgi:hypothetical protein
MYESLLLSMTYVYALYAIKNPPTGRVSENLRLLRDNSQQLLYLTIRTNFGVLSYRVVAVVGFGWSCTVLSIVQ